MVEQGYKKIMLNCSENAKALADAIVATGRFTLLSKPQGVPLVAFSLKDSSRHDEYEIADGLRKYGWIVPAYTMAPNAQHVNLLRVVVREDFSRGLADRLVTDLKRVLTWLDTQPPKLIQAVTEAIRTEQPELDHAKVTADDVKKSPVFQDHMKHHEVAANKKKHAKSHHKHSLQKTNGIC